MILAMPIGLLLVIPVVAGLQLMFRSMSALDATTFPRTLIPVAIWMLSTVAGFFLLALPIRWLFRLLARLCGVVCPTCRRHLMDHTESVTTNGTCPHCKSVILLD